MRRLFDSVDAAPLIWARTVFGACMAIEVYRYFDHGWIHTYFIAPQLHFSYPGFSWVKPLPGVGMYVLFALMGAAALGVALNRLYRPSALVLAVTWSWAFFCDQANYLNHGYLLCLLAWLFVVVPMGRVVPRWAVLLVTAQVALVYVFGGIAKLDFDWLRGDVARFFLSRTDFTESLAQSKPARVAFALAGLSFDLLVVPGLLWRRTRPVATAAAATFHLTNAWLFQIGVFPWVMLALTPIFYPPSFTRRLLRLDEPPLAPEPFAYRPAVAWAVVAWLAVQAALPLRHWLYPGQVNWTEEGHLFSWHMKLRVKRGAVTFRVAGVEQDVKPLLTRRQQGKMSTRPDLIRQLANELSRRSNGAPVTVDARASLNGRPWQPLVEPNVDLGKEPRTLAPARWIVPLADVPPAEELGDEDVD